MLIAGAVAGCSPGSEGDSKTVRDSTGDQTPSAPQRGTNPVAKVFPTGGDGASAFRSGSGKVTQAIRNIRSYLVDLEDELRLGPAGTWEMKASAAGHIARSIRVDVDTLARAGLDVGGLRSSLSSLSGSLASASEANWNNLVSSGHSEIDTMRAALSNLEKKN